MGHADAPSGDLQQVVARQQPAGEGPVVVTADGHDRRDPPETVQGRRVGDVPRVDDHLAAGKEFIDLGGDAGKVLPGMGVGDHSDP